MNSSEMTLERLPERDYQVGEGVAGTWMGQECLLWRKYCLFSLFLSPIYSSVSVLKLRGGKHVRGNWGL